MKRKRKRLFGLLLDKNGKPLTTATAISNTSTSAIGGDDDEEDLDNGE